MIFKKREREREFKQVSVTHYQNFSKSLFLQLALLNSHGEELLFQTVKLNVNIFKMHALLIPL